MTQDADYVAVIRQAIEGKCRSDIGEVTLADAIVVQLLAAGFEIVPMDPRVKRLVAPMQRLIDGDDGEYHDRFCEQDAEGRCFCDRRRLRHIDGSDD